MKSAASCSRGTVRVALNNRGSSLAAALALVFLIFAVTTVALTRVAASYAQISMRHSQTSALFLAEAGINKAASRLLRDGTYQGEKDTQLPAGSFDVSVTRGGAGYIVTSTGRANSALRDKQKKTLRATVRISGKASYKVSDWRENP